MMMQVSEVSDKEITPQTKITAEEASVTVTQFIEIDELKVAPQVHTTCSSYNTN